MVTFARNPVPETSGYGDGRFLLHMLAQRRAAANTPQEVVAAPDQQPLSVPQQLVDPTIFANDIYAPDPMANAEINPLAAPATGSNTIARAPITPPTNMPAPRPGVSNVPIARPEMQGPQQSAQSRVGGVMDNMRDMLGQNASAATAIDNIDGNPASSTEAVGSEGNPWWANALRVGGMAALVAAILSGRGRSAQGITDAMPGRSVAPYDPGMTGEIMGNPRLSGPSAVSPSPSQIETDILNATPNELPGPQRSVAIRPNDAPVAQGRPQSVNPDVMQGSPQPRGAIANNSVRYRGQVYSIDANGNVLDRNGDVVTAQTTKDGVLKAAGVDAAQDTGRGRFQRNPVTGKLEADVVQDGSSISPYGYLD